MELLIIIFIVWIVKTVIKQNKTSNSKVNNTNTYTNPRKGGTNSTRPQPTPNVRRQGKTAAQLKDEIWERLSEESKAKMLKKDGAGGTNGYTQNVLRFDNKPTTKQQIHSRRVENRTTSILDRAKGNVKEHVEDVTLNTMEAEHNHSERVSAAVHNHPEDIIPENMLGTVEDLMVKGYDGNLCFERDFVGEAMDMISRFTVPSEVPEYGSKNV